MGLRILNINDRGLLDRRWNLHYPRYHQPASGAAQIQNTARYKRASGQKGVMQSDRSSTVQSDRRRLTYYVSRLLLHGMARLPPGARATNVPLGARRDRDSYTMRGDWLLLLAQISS